LSPTEAGVAGVFGAAGLGLSDAESGLLAGDGEGHGLVTPPAAADSRSVVAGGGVAPETGEGIGLVVEVAGVRGADGTGGVELPDPDESDDFDEFFAESFDELDEPEEPLVEPEEPDDGSLPFCALPFLLSDSGFGSGFFRTTVSG
jgi:hypothetical protein